MDSTFQQSIPSILNIQSEMRTQDRQQICEAVMKTMRNCYKLEGPGRTSKERVVKDVTYEVACLMSTLCASLLQGQDDQEWLNWRPQEDEEVQRAFRAAFITEPVRQYSVIIPSQNDEELEYITERLKNVPPEHEAAKKKLEEARLQPLEEWSFDAALEANMANNPNAMNRPPFFSSKPTNLRIEVEQGSSIPSQGRKNSKYPQFPAQEPNQQETIQEQHEFDDESSQMPAFHPSQSPSSSPNAAEQENESSLSSIRMTPVRELYLSQEEFPFKPRVQLYASNIASAKSSMKPSVKLVLSRRKQKQKQKEQEPKPERDHRSELPPRNYYIPMVSSTKGALQFRASRKLNFEEK